MKQPNLKILNNTNLPISVNFRCETLSGEPIHMLKNMTFIVDLPKLSFIEKIKFLLKR